MIAPGLAELRSQLTKRTDSKSERYPHGRSIKWPRVYEALRHKGMPKSQAAAISNAMANRRRSRKDRATRKSASVTKGGLPVGLHVNQPLDDFPEDDEDLWTDEEVEAVAERLFSLHKREPVLLGLQDLEPVTKHLGPGAHPSGSGQEAHSGSGEAAAARISDAVDRLGKGEVVTLSSTRRLGALFEELEDRYDDGHTTNYPLGNVRVSGTELMSKGSLDIPREDMPQLSGQPIPGSKADALPRNKRGRVSVDTEFVEHMNRVGKAVVEERVDPTSLRATQSDLSSVKTIGLMKRLREGPDFTSGHIFVTGDNYILDGHHRWAAYVGTKLTGDPKLTMPIRRIKGDIGSVLDEAHSFATDIGMRQVSTDVIKYADLDVELLRKHPPEPHTTGTTQQAHAGGEAGAEGSSGGKGGGIGVDTGLEFKHSGSLQTRGAAIERFINEHAAELDTEVLYRDAETEEWDPERAALHEEILSEELAKVADVPSERQMVFVGGLTGAGKTSLLRDNDEARKNLGIEFGNGRITSHAIINADDFKEILHEKDAVPKVKGLASGEMAAATHEESSYLSKQFAERLLERGKNVIWDGTLASARSTERKINQGEEAGYGRPRAVFVDVSMEHSARAATERYRRGFETWRKNPSSFGGRFVPDWVLDSQRPKGSSFRSGNREAFEQLQSAGRFSNTEVWDNDNFQTKLVQRRTVSPSGKVTEVNKDAQDPAVAAEELFRRRIVMGGARGVGEGQPAGRSRSRRDGGPDPSGALASDRGGLQRGALRSQQRDPDRLRSGRWSDHPGSGGSTEEDAAEGREPRLQALDERLAKLVKHPPTPHSTGSGQEAHGGKGGSGEKGPDRFEPGQRWRNKKDGSWWKVKSTRNDGVVAYLTGRKKGSRISTLSLADARRHYDYVTPEEWEARPKAFEVGQRWRERSDGTIWTVGSARRVQSGGRPVVARMVIPGKKGARISNLSLADALEFFDPVQRSVAKHPPTPHSTGSGQEAHGGGGDGGGGDEDGFDEGEYRRERAELIRNPTSAEGLRARARSVRIKELLAERSHAQRRKLEEALVARGLSTATPTEVLQTAAELGIGMSQADSDAVVEIWDQVDRELP